MATVCESFAICSIKIQTEVSGQDSQGTGFLYITSRYNDFNYIFTAKHTFMIDPEDKEVFIDQIRYIDLLTMNLESKEYERYGYLKTLIEDDNFIQFNADLVLLKVKKNPKFSKPLIKVSDKGLEDCMAYAFTGANTENLLPLTLQRKLKASQTYTIKDWDSAEGLKGCSGAGIISFKEPVLQGFIMCHPTKEFEGKYIDAVNITFNEINNTLHDKGLEELECVENKKSKRRIINNQKVIDLNLAVINNVSLNLSLAAKRLRYDLTDDWFHDPLSYIDLYNEDFLYQIFESAFCGEEYKVQTCENFFLPKSTFTLRKAMIMAYSDRLYYSALVQEIGESINSALLPVVYSARYNTLQTGGLIISGIEQWKKMKYQVQRLSHQYKYVLEIDILNFYDNIDINLLCSKILTVCQNENERNATDELRKVLETFANNSKFGIPQNNDASSLLATVYLSEIDTYMKHLVPEYIRFMDDIKIFCDDKYEARAYLKLLEMELRKLKLSLNGQKTKIIDLRPNDQIDKESIKSDYHNFFNLKRSKLSRLSNSSNFLNINESFHLAVNTILKYINDDSIGVRDNERTLLHAISVIKRGKIKGVSIESESKLSEFLKLSPVLLQERPWVTPQITSLVGILDPDNIPDEFWEKTQEILLSDIYSMYPWQCYHLWLLFAKHKIKRKGLLVFASKLLKSNDDMNRPVVAAVMIYMVTIDVGYREVILNQFQNNFTTGHFQDRAALIALRSLNPLDVFTKQTHLKPIHNSLYKYKDKDLVFINGESLDDELNTDLIQIYSL